MGATQRDNLTKIFASMDTTLYSILDNLRDIKYKSFSDLSGVTNYGTTPANASQGTYDPANVDDETLYFHGDDYAPTAFSKAFERNRPIIVSVCYDGCGDCDRFKEKVTDTAEFQAFLKEADIYYFVPSSVTVATALQNNFGECLNTSYPILRLLKLTYVGLTSGGAQLDWDRVGGMLINQWDVNSSMPVSDIIDLVKSAFPNDAYDADYSAILEDSPTPTIEPADDNEVYWLNWDMVTGVKRASETGRPILVQYGYKGCGHCDIYHKYVAESEKFRNWCNTNRVYYVAEERTHTKIGYDIPNPGGPYPRFSILKFSNVTWSDSDSITGGKAVCLVNHGSNSLRTFDLPIYGIYSPNKDKKSGLMPVSFCAPDERYIVEIQNGWRVVVGISNENLDELLEEYKQIIIDSGYYDANMNAIIPGTTTPAPSTNESKWLGKVLDHRDTGTSSEDAFKYAFENKRPLLMVFGYHGCGHCDVLYNQVLTTSEWREFLKKKAVLMYHCSEASESTFLEKTTKVNGKSLRDYLTGAYPQIALVSVAPAEDGTFYNPVLTVCKLPNGDPCVFQGLGPAGTQFGVDYPVLTEMRSSDLEKVVNAWFPNDCWDSIEPSAPKRTRMLMAASPAVLQATATEETEDLSGYQEHPPISRHVSTAPENEEHYWDDEMISLEDMLEKVATRHRPLIIDQCYDGCGHCDHLHRQYTDTKIFRDWLKKNDVYMWYTKTVNAMTAATNKLTDYGRRSDFDAYVPPRQNGTPKVAQDGGAPWVVMVHATKVDKTKTDGTVVHTYKVENVPVYRDWVTGEILPYTTNRPLDIANHGSLYWTKKYVSVLEPFFFQSQSTKPEIVSQVPWEQFYASDMAPSYGPPNTLWGAQVRLWENWAPTKKTQIPGTREYTEDYIDLIGRMFPNEFWDKDLNYRLEVEEDGTSTLIPSCKDEDKWLGVILTSENSSPDLALKYAAENNRPLLVDYGYIGCGACELVYERAFSTSAWKKFLTKNKFVMYRTLTRLEIDNLWAAWTRADYVINTGYPKLVMYHVRATVTNGQTVYGVDTPKMLNPEFYTALPIQEGGITTTYGVTLPAPTVIESSDLENLVNVWFPNTYWDKDYNYRANQSSSGGSSSGSGWLDTDKWLGKIIMLQGDIDEGGNPVDGSDRRTAALTALKYAAENNRPLLVDYGYDGCGSCRYVYDRAFNTDAWRNFLTTNKLVMYKTRSSIEANDAFTAWTGSDYVLPGNYPHLVMYYVDTDTSGTTTNMRFLTDGTTVYKVRTPILTSNDQLHVTAIVIRDGGITTPYGITLPSPPQVESSDLEALVKAWFPNNRWDTITPPSSPVAAWTGRTTWYEEDKWLGKILTEENSSPEDAVRYAAKNNRPLLLDYGYDGCGACDVFYEHVLNTSGWKQYLKDRRIVMYKTKTGGEFNALYGKWSEKDYKLGGAYPWLVMYHVTETMKDYVLEYEVHTPKAKILNSDNTFWTARAIDRGGGHTLQGVEIPAVSDMTPEDLAAIIEAWFPNDYWDTIEPTLPPPSTQTGTDTTEEAVVYNPTTPTPTTTGRQKIVVKISVINAKPDGVYFAHVGNDVKTSYYAKVMKVYSYMGGQLVEGARGYLVVQAYSDDVISFCQLDDYGISKCNAVAIDNVTDGWAFIEYDAQTCGLRDVGFLGNDDITQQLIEAMDDELNSTFGDFTVDDLYGEVDDLRTAKRLALENARPLLIYLCYDACEMCQEYKRQVLESSTFQKFLADYQVVFVPGFHSSGTVARLISMLQSAYPGTVENTIVPQMAMVKLTAQADLESNDLASEEFELIQTEKPSDAGHMYAWWQCKNGVVAYGEMVGLYDYAVFNPEDQTNVYKAWFPNKFYRKNGRALMQMAMGTTPFILAEDGEDVTVTILFENPQPDYVYYATLNGKDGSKLYPEEVNGILKIVLEAHVGDAYSICQYKHTSSLSAPDPASCVAGIVDGRSSVAHSATVRYDCVNQTYTFETEEV